MRLGGRDLRGRKEIPEKGGEREGFWDTAEEDEWLSQLALVVKAFLLVPQTAPMNDSKSKGEEKKSFFSPF